MTIADIVTLLAVTLAISMTGSTAAFYSSRTADLVTGSKCLSSAAMPRLGTLGSAVHDPDAWEARAADPSAALRRRYEASGGVLYRQSVLSDAERRGIEAGLASLRGRLADEAPSSVAFRRVGAPLPPDGGAARALADPRGSVSRLVNAAVRGGESMVLAEEVPVEVRVYEKRGAGMEWHVDDVLYSPPQVEVVLTLENTSDCVTAWETRGTGVDAKRVEVETAPNSALLLEAGGARHRVSPLKHGRRVILKFAYVKKGASMLDGFEEHSRQFPGAKKRTNKKRKRRTR